MHSDQTETVVKMPFESSGLLIGINFFTLHIPMGVTSMAILAVFFARMTAFISTFSFGKDWLV